MEYRLLGSSGLYVSALSLGAATFGAGTRGIGGVDDQLADKMIGTCIDAGVNLFDVADSYSSGESEAMMGRVLRERRASVLISTKFGRRIGALPNAIGASRHHIVEACEASLKRLQTDHIDLYQLHGFDAMTALEETLRALGDLVKAGKVRYIGASNFSGWQLMKALAVADQWGTPRFVQHQVCYSIIGRDVEFELVPLARDQNIGLVAWGALAFGMLGGKFRRGQPMPEGTRATIMRATGSGDNKRLAGLLGTATDDDLENLYTIVDTADGIARAHGVTVAQVALNYVLRKPAVSSVLMGARTLEQLNDNLGAARWQLLPEDVAKLDAVNVRAIPYPYWVQRLSGAERDPPPPGYVL